MPIEYNKRVAIFQGVVGVDDAEPLLEWLQKKPSAKLDLRACTHIHPANLQVLMASNPTVAHWPASEDLKTWLTPLFKS